MAVEKKTCVLFITFGGGASGPQRWAARLLKNKTFNSEVLIHVWHIADLYRGITGKIKLFADCKEKLSLRNFDKVYISQDLNMAALLTLNFRLLGFSDLIVHSHASKFYSNDRSVKPQFYQKIVRFLVRQKVAVSQGASIAMFGKDGGNVTIVPAFIDFKKLWDDSIKDVPSVQVSDKVSFFFGCVGRFSQEKNQQLIIRALAKIREKNIDAGLILIGDGKLRSECEKLALDKGLENHVVFTGEIDNTALYYRNLINVLLVPSLYEGQGRTIAEAQFFNLPVVVSSVVPQIAFLTDECVYRIDSLSEVDWAEVMEERIKKAPERNSLNMEMVLNHPDLAMESGVAKVLKLIKS